MIATIQAEPANSDPPQSSAEAVSDLVFRYGSRLYGLARRLCHNQSDAEDLVQETFLQAHRKFIGFQGRSDPGTWLYTIAVRLCRRKFGHGNRRRVPPLADVMPFRDRSVAEMPADGPSLLTLQIDRETLEAVQRQIASLPAMFRVPLVLKDVLDLSVGEVAEVLGIKPQTVKTRVFRARLIVRRLVMSRLPQRPAPAPTYERQVCIDLLAAKMDAMNHGRGFPIGREVLCERCQAVFRELDLTQAACAGIADGSLPTSLRREVLSRLEEPTPPTAGVSGNRAPRRRLKAGAAADRAP